MPKVQRDLSGSPGFPVHIWPAVFQSTTQPLMKSTPVNFLEQERAGVEWCVHQTFSPRRPFTNFYNSALLLKFPQESVLPPGRSMSGDKPLGLSASACEDRTDDSPLRHPSDVLCSLTHPFSLEATASCFSFHQLDSRLSISMDVLLATDKQDDISGQTTRVQCRPEHTRKYSLVLETPSSTAIISNLYFC